MKKALEKFNNAANSINSRVSTLQTEISVKKSEHENASELYRKAMIEDAAGTKDYSTSELTELKKHAEGIASEIATATERLEMLSDGCDSGKKEKLQTLLEDVRTAWNLDLIGLNAAIERINEEARGIRAQLTIKIGEANVHYRKAQELKQELNTAERAAGLTFREEENRLGVPEQPILTQGFTSGFGSHVGDRCVIPHEDELKKAYTHGDLPAWIQHYSDTGELLTNDEVRQLEPNEVKQKEKGVISRLLSR